MTKRLTEYEVDCIAAAYFRENKTYQEQKRLHEERKLVFKAHWLGYTCVEQMEDHLSWLETRFPEGAEL